MRKFEGFLVSILVVIVINHSTTCQFMGETFHHGVLAELCLSGSDSRLSRTVGKIHSSVLGKDIGDQICNCVDTGLRWLRC